MYSVPLSTVGNEVVEGAVEAVGIEKVVGALVVLTLTPTLLETATLEIVEEETLLELTGASLILRAPLIPLLVVGLPSVFFM